WTVRETSAYPRALRSFVPLNITFSIVELRRTLAFCSPIAHLTASTILVFPQPLGPTIAVIPVSKSTVTLSAKDLNPNISSLLKYNYLTSINFIDLYITNIIKILLICYLIVNFLKKSLQD